MTNKKLQEMPEAQLFNMGTNKHYKEVFAKVRQELESRLGLVGSDEWTEEVNF